MLCWGGQLIGDVVFGGACEHTCFHLVEIASLFVTHISVQASRVPSHSMALHSKISLCIHLFDVFLGITCEWIALICEMRRFFVWLNRIDAVIMWHEARAKSGRWNDCRRDLVQGILELVVLRLLGLQLMS